MLARRAGQAIAGDALQVVDELLIAAGDALEELEPCRRVAARRRRGDLRDEIVAGSCGRIWPVRKSTTPACVLSEPRVAYPRFPTSLRRRDRPGRSARHRRRTRPWKSAWPCPATRWRARGPASGPSRTRAWCARIARACRSSDTTCRYRDRSAARPDGDRRMSSAAESSVTVGGALFIAARRRMLSAVTHARHPAASFRDPRCC